MHKFVRSLVTEWRRLGLPADDAAVVIAVSGGADSASLLGAMYELRELEKLRLRLVAAHFNHGLRGAASDEDEEFVRELTTEFRVEFASGRGLIASDGNLEENARRARYAFLRETAERVGAFAVLTGHTMNDQAETLLMNLVRGSGPAGLSGMKAIDAFGSRGATETRRQGDKETGRQGDRKTKLLFVGQTSDTDPFSTHLPVSLSPFLPFSSTPQLQLVRPLMHWAKRGDTEMYCRDAGIEYRYDTMNDDTAFRRVKIRKILLPLLADMNPNIIETLANTAALLQREVPRELPPVTESEDGSLYVTQLRSLPDNALGDALRDWLEKRRGTRRRLGMKHLQAVERLVKSTKSGRVVELPGGGRVIRSGGKLRFADAGS
ncbi:MAG: tRNA lysidine(34) synthetase TilS [Acidobacteriota bacterium]|nr:MAG: tRNA lysidine(34) synthetase TilS [Acidobacteriota bacterium]